MLIRLIHSESASEFNPVNPFRFGFGRRGSHSDGDTQRPGKIAQRTDRAKIDGSGRHGVFGILGVGEGVGLGGRRNGAGGLGRLVRHGN